MTSKMSGIKCVRKIGSRNDGLYTREERIDMGMFDYVHFEMDCPKCVERIKDFQSKDFLCEMETIEPDALQNFYASCRKCKTWIEFSRPRPEGAPLRAKSLTFDDVAAMGFAMDVTANAKVTGT